jgi:hypothetical protein
VGPEGFPLAHTEEAEEEATRRACTFAHQVQYRGQADQVHYRGQAEASTEGRERGGGG